MIEPVLPYHGTEGFVDNDASRERAIREAVTGEASARQQAVLNVLLSAGENGKTWREVADALGLHHGQASGSLSVLHKDRQVFQLKQKRGKSHPYVHVWFSASYSADERIDDPAMVRNTKKSVELAEELQRWKNAAGIMFEAISEGDAETAMLAYLEVTEDGRKLA